MKPSNHVVLVDLERDADELAAEVFSEFQRKRLPQSTSGTVDASRVVLVAPSRLIGDAGSVIEQIVVSPSVKAMICVIRGEMEEAGSVISLPTMLDRPPVAAIWVDDCRGVVWTMGTAKARALTTSNSDPRGDGAFALLVDTLRLPEVFDEVFARTKEIGALVSPAVRVLIPGAVAPQVTESAETSAVNALTGGGEPNLELTMSAIPSELEARRALFGESQAPSDFFEPQGRIGQLARQVDHRRADVDVAIAELVSQPPLSHAPVAAVRKAICEVGEALATLKGELAELFGKVDGSNGLDNAEIRTLKSVGVRPGSTKGAVVEETAEAEPVLPAYATAVLRRSRSLQEVVGELRTIESRATPRTTSETLALLDAACPEEMIQSLRQHPALRVSVTSVSSLSLLAAIAAAAATMFAGYVVLPFAMLAALGGFFFYVAHGRSIAFIRGTSRKGVVAKLRNRSTYLVSTAVILGLIVGGIVRGVTDTTAAHALGSVAVVVLLVAFALHAWRVSSKAWLAEADLAGARAAGDRLLDVTADVLMNDWILANPRTRFAESAGRLAAALEEIRVALLGPLAPGKEPESSKRDKARATATLPDDPELECNSAIRAHLAEESASTFMKQTGRLQEIVMQDYLDAISAVIQDQWPLIAGAEEKDGQDACREAMQRRLFAYRHDLRRHGLFGARVFVNGRDESALSPEGRQRRRALLEELWESLDLDDLIGLSADSELVQLCSPEQLARLDQDAALAKLVRFAPGAAAASSRKTGMVRSSQMQMAGLLRLVRLRAGTVRFGVDASGVSVDEQQEAEFAVAVG